MKYEVSGTIEMNWSVEVEADSEDEAERKARLEVLDGNGLDSPVGDPEVDYVGLME